MLAECPGWEGDLFIANFYFNCFLMMMNEQYLISIWIMQVSQWCLYNNVNALWYYISVLYYLVYVSCSIACCVTLWDTVGCVYHAVSRAAWHCVILLGVCTMQYRVLRDTVWYCWVCAPCSIACYVTLCDTIWCVYHAYRVLVILLEHSLFKWAPTRAHLSKGSPRTLLSYNTMQ